MRVLLVGGVGYLGFNIASWHRGRGDEVLVVARPSSVERRRRLAESISRYARIVTLSTLRGEERASSLLHREGCPDILYLLAGRLRGGREELIESNALLARDWARAARGCSDTLVVYASSLLAVGDVSRCARGGVVVEEERHLEGCRPLGPSGESKALGEKLVLEACRGSRVSTLVLRPGLLVGAWAYHPEWRLLRTLAKLHMRLRGGPWIHATPAIDVARAAVHLLERGSLDCTWAYATPYRLTIGELHEKLRRAMGIERAIPVPLAAPPARLLPEPLRVMLVQGRYRIRPARLEEAGFTWTSLEEALRYAAMDRDNW